MRARPDREIWDAVVIGSGFGGSMVALRLAEAGLGVLVLERGRWVDRDDSAWDARAVLVDRKYRSATPFQAARRWHGLPGDVYVDEAVGGGSVFYGAASFRLRQEDFGARHWFDAVAPDGARGARWPVTYADLAPYYEEAERLLDVAGRAGADPTEPPRRSPYPQPPAPYSAPARRITEAAQALALRPFPIPLAIAFNGGNGRNPCVRCTTCDLFPCKLEAKNDLSVTVIPAAVRRGAVVLARTVAARLRMERGRVRAVECLNAATGEAFTVRCRLCVVSCGAIASPALLIRSGLAHGEPHGRLVGRHLMRHCSGIVIGIFPFRTNPEGRFHKQVAITDFYFGHPDGRGPAGNWGMIQGLQVPPPEYIAAEAPFPIGTLGARTSAYHIYLLCLAEDLPDPENRVEVYRRRTDRFGVPIARAVHRYHRRDREARRALYGEAARILRQAGAWLRIRKPIDTYSHAVGTCRFGNDPRRAVLDPWCNFFGVPNLYVVDGSFMPTSGGVNPSLTIAANALRVGRHLAHNADAVLHE